MRKLLALTVGLWLSALLCLSALVLISTSLPDVEIVAYFESHLQTKSGTWCWQGICPKRTAFTQAKLQIEASGEKVIEDQIANTLLELRPDTFLNFYSMDSSETSPITVVDVIFRANVMTLGDAYCLFGTPTLVWRGDRNISISQRGLCFKGGVCAYFEVSHARLSPFTPITGLSIYGSNAAGTDGYLAWRGFVAVPPF